MNNNSNKFYNILLTFLLTLVFILLFICLVRLLIGAPNVSLSGFMAYLQDAPAFPDFNTTIDIFHISGHWLVLDELREFINVLGSIFGFLIWVVADLISSLEYVFYFMAYLFV